MASLQAAFSIFRFQLVWGLSAGVQHAVNFFHQQGVSVSAKPLHGYCSGYSSLCVEVLSFVLWLNYYYFVLLDCFCLFIFSLL